MSLGGWFLLAISWGAILSLATFCFWRVFSKKEVK
jgi:hypothetical protein